MRDSNPGPSATRRHLLCLTGALALGIGGCCKMSRPRRLQPSDIILCLGDALTQGYGVGREESFPARLHALVGRAVVNEGHYAETAGGLLPRVSELLSRHQPALVLISLSAPQEPEAEMHARALAELVHAVACGPQNPQVVLLAQPALGPAGLVKVLRDAPLYEAVAKDCAVPLVPGLWAEVLSTPRLRLDPAHPNAEGHLQFALQLAGWLKQSGYL